MLRKPALYEKVIKLRSRGLSYNEILRHVRVGNGTISRWCSGITLTEGQMKRLLHKKRNTILIKTLRKRSLISKNTAKAWAREQIDKLKTDSLLFVIGIVFYWAEGTKLNESKGGHKGIEVTNTDPRVIKIMMRFFREVLGVPKSKFRAIVRIGSQEESVIRRSEKYWSRVTGIRQKRFVKAESLILKENSKSLIKYPCGMCRIIIRDVDVARKIDFLIKKFYKKFRHEITI
jgi:hypothetical protein